MMKLNLRNYSDLFMPPIPSPLWGEWKLSAGVLNHDFKNARPHPSTLKINNCFQQVILKIQNLYRYLYLRCGRRCSRCCGIGFSPAVKTLYIDSVIPPSPLIDKMRSSCSIQEFQLFSSVLYPPLNWLSCSC